jgi:RimJ/RimL family protein N-acetyltransferase
MIIDTQRLRLRAWQQSDRDAFADMHTHPEVMHDYGGILTRAESDEKFDRYAATFEQHGFCRWAIESPNSDLLGYAGLMPVDSSHPLGAHVDIGWRLVRSVWGNGYAAEAAAAALEDAFVRVGLSEVIGYTAPDNLRSQAVMIRLGMQRDRSRDFTMNYDFVPWHGMVWAKRPA